MNAWDEIQAENEADARATMESERCTKCGALLVDHYNDDRVWIDCAAISSETKVTPSSEECRIHQVCYR